MAKPATQTQEMTIKSIQCGNAIQSFASVKTFFAAVDGFEMKLNDKGYVEIRSAKFPDVVVWVGMGNIVNIVWETKK